MSVAPDGLL